MDKYASMSDLLMSELKLPYKMLQLPIVPVFNSPTLDTRKLKAIDIPFNNSLGFWILEEQFVLAYSPALMSDEASGNSIDDINDVVEEINTRSPIRFEIFGNTPKSNPKNSTIKLVWLIQSSKLSKLKSMSGETLGLKDWGFPWDGYIEASM